MGTVKSSTCTWGFPASRDANQGVRARDTCLTRKGRPQRSLPPFRAASVPLHRTRAVRSTARARGWHAIFFARRPCPFPRLGSPRSRPTRIGSRPPCFHGAVLGITSVECGLLYSSSSLVFPSPVWESESVACVAWFGFYMYLLRSSSISTC